MLLDFYMPLRSIVRTLQFFIIPQHQPLISILTLIYTTILLSHQRSGVHQQLTQQSKNYNNKKISYQKELVTFLFHTASYAYLPPSIPQTFFNAIASSIIHRSTQNLSSITHKQIELPTHAFLAIVMDIFPLQECKKVTANENNKTKMKP